MDPAGGRLIRDLGASLPAVVAGVLPVLFIPICVDSYILPRTSLVLAGAGLGVALSGWLAVGRAGLGGGEGLGGLRWPVLAVGLAACIAAITSIAPGLSLFGAYSRYESLPVRLAYLGLLASAVWLLRSAGDRARVVSWFLAGCTLASLEAVGQAVSGALARPDGNLGQPNLLGVLLAMALVLGLGRAWRDGRWWPLVLVLGAGLYVSSSRSGWLGALAGAAVWLALSRRTSRGAWLGLGLGAVAAVAVLGVLLVSPLRNLNQDTGSARVGVWRDTVSLVAARPLTGWGEEGFGVVFGRYQSHDWEPGNSFDRAHSQPLDLLATQGLIGLGAGGWLWLALGRGLWRRRLAGGEEVAALGGALAAYAGWSLLNFDWAPATGAAWLLAGVGWSAVQGGQGGRGGLGAGSGAGGVGAGAGGEAVVSSAAERRRAAGLAWAVAASGLGVLAWLLAVPPVVADLHYYAGRPAAAVGAWPWQARYHQALADVLGGRERLEELRMAGRLGSTDTGLWIALGDAEASAGDAEAARRDWQRAVEIYPYDRAARERLGLIAPP